MAEQSAIFLLSFQVQAHGLKQLFSSGLVAHVLDQIV